MANGSFGEGSCRETVDGEGSSHSPLPSFVDTYQQSDPASKLFVESMKVKYELWLGCINCRGHHSCAFSMISSGAPPLKLTKNTESTLALPL